MVTAGAEAATATGRSNANTTKWTSMAGTRSWLTRPPAGPGRLRTCIFHDCLISSIILLCNRRPVLYLGPVARPRRFNAGNSRGGSFPAQHSISHDVHDSIRMWHFLISPLEERDTENWNYKVYTRNIEFQLLIYSHRSIATQ